LKKKILVLTSLLCVMVVFGVSAVTKNNRNNEVVASVSAVGAVPSTETVTLSRGAIAPIENKDSVVEPVVESKAVVKEPVKEEVKEEVVVKEVEKADTVSDSTIRLLARLINSEAGIEPYKGKVAVGAVVMTRAKGDVTKIKKVVYAKGQFNGVGTNNFDEEPSEDCIRAAKEAINGADPTGGANYFVDLRHADPDWAHEFKFMGRIGNHWFYKE
jgi:spore germination cell wall hydrolase CwlJ-like protein